ncbi:MAG: hypothetical protein SGILL_007743, partial [Bacillariaceae sp.]
CEVFRGYGFNDYTDDYYNNDYWGRDLQIIIFNCEQHQRSTIARLALGVVILVLWVIDLAFGLYGTSRLARSQANAYHVAVFHDGIRIVMEERLKTRFAFLAGFHLPFATIGFDYGSSSAAVSDKGCCCCGVKADEVETSLWALEYPQKMESLVWALIKKEKQDAITEAHRSILMSTGGQALLTDSAGQVLTQSMPLPVMSSPSSRIPPINSNKW